MLAARASLASRDSVSTAIDQRYTFRDTREFCESFRDRTRNSDRTIFFLYEPTPAITYLVENISEAEESNKSDRSRTRAAPALPEIVAGDFNGTDETIPFVTL